jgi:mono/diheme cytochrome c family protein
MRLAHDKIETSRFHDEAALPLPLAGEGRGGGLAASRAVHVGRVSLTRIASFAAMLALAMISNPAHADGESGSRPQAPLSPGFRFTEATGEELFASACQGCHMSDGKGAIGAGTYPSLVQDSHLETGGYPLYVVVRGQRAMPPIGAMMSDAQVAAVVNYVRTHFGNQYQDAVTTDDVKRVRP